MWPQTDDLTQTYCVTDAGLKGNECVIQQLCVCVSTVVTDSSWELHAPPTSPRFGFKEKVLWLEIERNKERKMCLCAEAERVTGDNLLCDRSTAGYRPDVTAGHRGNRNDIFVPVFLCSREETITVVTRYLLNVTLTVLVFNECHYEIQ